MSHSRRRFLAAAAVGSVGLAGCLGTDGDGNGGGGATPTTTATESPMNGATATVRARTQADLGDILVDGAGMTLYLFENDEQGAGSSACTGGCADAWPPLTVDGEPTAGEGVTAALSAFARGDGATQVAAGGWPLYGFGGDSEPGDAAGQGSDGVWWVLAPDGTPRRSGGASPTPTETDGVDPY